MNSSIELREVVLDRVKFRNKTLLKDVEAKLHGELKVF